MEPQPPQRKTPSTPASASTSNAPPPPPALQKTPVSTSRRALLSCFISIPAHGIGVVVLSSRHYRRHFLCATTVVRRDHSSPASPRLPSPRPSNDENLCALLFKRSVILVEICREVLDDVRITRRVRTGDHRLLCDPSFIDPRRMRPQCAFDFKFKTKSRTKPVVNPVV